MKFVLLIVPFLTSILAYSQNIDATNYFVKREAKTDSTRQGPLYRLQPVQDKRWSYFPGLNHTISSVSTFQDSVRILRSLLEFEGDTDLVWLEAMNYSNSNPERTDYFVPDDSLYHATVEIEALFIFNTLIEPKEFFVASYPRLQAKKIGAPGFDVMFLQNDDRLSTIFELYRKWLSKCEKEETFRIGQYPLEGSGFSWL